jgi:hypothetical protein
MVILTTSVTQFFYINKNLGLFFCNSDISIPEFINKEAQTAKMI